MLLTTVLLFFILEIFIGTEASIQNDIDRTIANSKLKEITVAIEHDLKDGHSQSGSKKNSPSKRTRANLLLNSKLIYPPGAKRASAFNQGILKFQQLLDLPIDSTPSTQDNLESMENETTGAILNSTNDTEPVFSKLKCEDSLEHEESDNTSKLVKKKFIEDFESSKENTMRKNVLEKEEIKIEPNKTEELNSDMLNKTEEVEIINPTLELSNGTKNDTRKDKSSIEILDDDKENETNNTMNLEKIGNQTSYLPAKLKSIDVKVIEIKPQTVQEIPLNLNHANNAGKTSKSKEKDDISQTIKRDILLGNLNPFFTNPSTSSIRNTNTLFFDETSTTPRSSKLIAPMNPFSINAFAVDTFTPASFGRSSFSRLRSRPSRPSKASVESVPSIPISEDGESGPTIFGASSSRKSQKATVKTVPALLISQENKSSSKYKNRPTSVSSASFSITPSISKSRSSPSRSYSRTRTSKTRPSSSSGFNRIASTSSFSRPTSAPSILGLKPGPSFSKPASSPANSEGVEVLKSVEYALPEEVGKSLAKTGPAKFKRKAGFESRGHSEYNMQKSITVNPLTLNLDMSHTQAESLNPYLLNTQMKNINHNHNFQMSRSFDFRPSKPDTVTSRVREFRSNSEGNSYFQPSVEFSRITESPQDTDNAMLEKSDFYVDDERENQMQRINNFESDVLFKPFFVTQSPKSFQMPESTTFSFKGNDVHMIDLSDF